MSDLRYLCFFAYSGVQRILCCGFLSFFSSSCVPYVASFSGFSICDYPFDILGRLFIYHTTKCRNELKVLFIYFDHKINHVNPWDD
jgi:hypothetical protein